MASVVDILPAVVARLSESPAVQNATGGTLTLRYQDDGQGDLPDTPTDFAYIEHENFGSGRGPAAFGGGRGSNLYRNEGLITVYAFTPRGDGTHTQVAENIAARLRSFRSDTMSCFSAAVRPVGDGATMRPRRLESEVNNYSCAIVEVAFHFDQIG